MLWTKTIANNKVRDIQRPYIFYNNRNYIAYRLHWELVRGPIPEGAFLCHKCDVSLCINLDHLYIGDAKTNMRDALERGKHGSFTKPERLRESGRRQGARIKAAFHNMMHLEKQVAEMKEALRQASTALRAGANNYAANLLDAAIAKTEKTCS